MLAKSKKPLNNFMLQGLKLNMKLFSNKKKSLHGVLMFHDVQKKHGAEKKDYYWNFSSIMWYFSIAPALTFDFQFQRYMSFIPRSNKRNVYIFFLPEKHC